MGQAWIGLEMNEETRKRVLSDLVIGFGFSKSNAERALQHYENNKLEMSELDAISYLEYHNPLKQPERIKQFPDPIILQAEMVETLEHLNFKITKEL